MIIIGILSIFFIVVLVMILTLMPIGNNLALVYLGSINYKPVGIKCDHCDYKDMMVNFEDYLSYVNKPCPVCGENLLTQEDYDLTVFIYDMFDKISKCKNFSIEMNGSGAKGVKLNDIS